MPLLPSPPPDANDTVRGLLTPIGFAQLGGWLVVTDVASVGGTTSLKVYQDTGNTVLRSVTSSTAAVLISLKASYPKVVVNGVPATLTVSADGGHYSGSVAATVATGDIPVQVLVPNGHLGTHDIVTITVNTPPVILTLAFSGGYPGAQTELKAGDTFTVVGTTDKPTVGLQFQDFEAGQFSVTTFGSTTSFSTTLTVADRGNVVQSLRGQAKARDATGAYGPAFTTTSTVQVNNLHPTLTFGTITYPATQFALKNSETAGIAVTTANLDSIIYDSPNAQLSVAAPTVIASPKTVTRIAGSYNVSVNNFRGIATRNANAATTTSQTVIAIAHVAPTLTATTPAARLRSGGNNGTSLQSHTITLTSDQQLQAAPSMSAGASGTFIGSFTGGPLVYTRTLQVHDNDAKGTFTWTSILGTGLAGLTTTSVVNPNYVLGGFVPRTLTFAAFSQSTALNVAVVTYAKLQAGIFTATNQPALRNSVQGNTSNIVNTYTVAALATNPTTIFWNDLAAANSNSGGTAAITAVEEIV